MDINVNVSEMEQQRYNAIKKSNSYMEVNVLIGKERETIGEYSGIVPVITTDFHDVGSKEIALMYATLKFLLSDFEERYPMECAVADLMKTHDMGMVTLKPEEEEDENETI